MSGDKFDKANNNWKPVPSRSECTARLAGHGSSVRAICYDLVFTGWRGPPMVVVPGMNGNLPFAIGKYEIKISDYSKYCVLTKACKPILDVGKLNYPKAGISLADAQKYVAWLSKRTGQKYRLPTREEWQYAASAPGAKPPAKPFKCRLSQLKVKGLNGMYVVDGRHGEANGWGLVNTVGNIQEWTVEPSGEVFASGGDYMMQDNECSVSTAFKHSRQADNVTGFRVLREIQ